MKHIRILFIALLLPLVTLAQDVNIKEGTVKMGKTKLWCFTATYQYAKDVTIDAMERKLSDANMRRSSRKKGFSVYKGGVLHAISGNKADFYYRVKSKKGKTMLSFSVSKGYDNYVTTSNDAVMAGNITKFLQDLNAQMALNEQIKTKEGELLQIQNRSTTLDKQQQETKRVEDKKMEELKALKMRPTYDK